MKYRYAFGSVSQPLHLTMVRRLAAARGVAGARHRAAELAVRILGIFLHHAGARQALLVAQLDAAQVEHAVLHGGEHLLPAPRALALIERRHDAERQVQSGTAVADLRAGHERRPVVESRGRGGSARALRHVLVYLAIFVRAGAKAFDRRDDHARIQFLDSLPREAHAVERARGEVLHQHIAVLDQLLEHFLALLALGVERYRALVMVQHGEIKTVDIRDIAQLFARHITRARLLDLDHIGAEPGEQLSAGRPGLHVSEIENANSVQCFVHDLVPIICISAAARFPARIRTGRSSFWPPPRGKFRDSSRSASPAWASAHTAP